MKITALVANVGLLLAMVWYLLIVESFAVERNVEWVVLVLALASPVVSIVALVPRRAGGGVMRTVAVVADVGLVAAIFTYFGGRDHLDLDSQELLLFAFLLSAPCLGVIALLRRRATGQPGAAPNGVPATSVGNSEVREGPPSVS